MTGPRAPKTGLDEARAARSNFITNGGLNS